MLVIDHFASTTRGMIGWRFERAFRAYSLTGYIGGVQGTPATMRMFQASATLRESCTRFWAVVHVCAAQYQTADTAGAVKRLVRWRNTLKFRNICLSSVFVNSKLFHDFECKRRLSFRPSIQ